MIRDKSKPLTIADVMDERVTNGSGFGMWDVKRPQKEILNFVVEPNDHEIPELLSRGQSRGFVRPLMWGSRHTHMCHVHQQ